MMDITFDESRSIVILDPIGAYTDNGVIRARESIDRHLNLRRKLRGIIFRDKALPGPETFQTLLSQLGFDRDKHKQVKNIALATDSEKAELDHVLSRHFSSADIRHFGHEEMESAERWIFNNVDYE